VWRTHSSRRGVGARGAEDTEQQVAQADDDEQFSLIKQERMPDGRTKLILRDKASGQIVQRIE
jgi:hypothetical protein